MRLYLIRHGRTNNNLEQVTQGWTDTDLDELGKVQAKAVANYFEPIPLQHIFSSDLKRSYETAVPTGELKSIEIEKTALLRERSLGQLENAPMSELRRAFEEEIARTGEDRCKVRPKGVESAYDVLDRVSKFASLIPVDQGNVAVFTHGMTQECLLCHLIGAPVESSRSFNFNNASITALLWDWNVWVLEKYNQTDHLPLEMS
ncbi:MAG: histidine phosphatase family protein [Armatimonadota bacterium]